MLNFVRVPSRTRIEASMSFDTQYPSHREYMGARLELPVEQIEPRLAFAINNAVKVRHHPGLIQLRRRLMKLAPAIGCSAPSQRSIARATGQRPGTPHATGPRSVVQAVANQFAGRRMHMDFVLTILPKGFDLPVAALERDFVDVGIPGSDEPTENFG